LFKDATKDIAGIDVIEHGHPYENNDIGIHIWYWDHSDAKLSCLHELIPSIAEIMDPASGGATARKVPGISYGWTVSNPNEYRNSRWNMLGSILPYISDGIKRQG
jgi:hypothetical protein